jgi:hypothetical protein
MATYFPEIAPYVPDIQQFQPDFGMQRQTLQIQQARYDRGHNAVQGGINNILNAPLTQFENQAVRDGFLKEASSRLAEIAKTDLSLHENVAAAEAIYEPFWKDTDIVADVTRTKQLQKAYQTAIATRDSKDEKVRAGYDDMALEYIANGFDELKNSKRGDGSIQAVEERRFVPFKSETEFLNKAAKDAGFSIDWTNVNGPQLITEKNGPRSLTNFRTFAEGVMGADFDAQNRVRGTVISERGIKNVRRAVGPVDKKTALGILAQSTIGELKTNYEKSLESSAHSIGKIDKDIEALKLKGTLVPQDVQRLEYLLNEKETLETKMSADQERYQEFADPNSKAYKDMQSRIVNNPEGYYATLAKQRIVNSWAAGQASNQGFKIDVNPIWKENNDVAYQQATLELTRETAMLNREKFEWEKTHPKKGTGFDTDGDGIPDLWVGGSGGTGSGSGPGGSGKPGEGEGHYIGLGTTDVTKTGSALQVYQKHVADTTRDANSRIFNVGGIAGVLKNIPNVSEDDVVTYTTWINRYLTNPGASQTTAEKQISSKLMTAVSKELGINPNTALGPMQQRDMILKFAEQYLGNQAANGWSTATPQDRKIYEDYTSTMQNLQEVNRMEEERKNSVRKLLANGEYKELTKTGADGKPDLITAEDIAAHLKPVTLTLGYRDKSGNKPLTQIYNAGMAIPDALAEGFGFQQLQTITLTPQQLAESMLKGGAGIIKGVGNWRYRAEDGSLLEIRGADFGNGDKRGVYGGITSQGISVHGTRNMHELDQMLQGVTKRFGNIEDMAGKYKRIQEAVVPDLSHFKSQTGRLGHQTQYDIDETEKATSPVMGKGIAQEILDPSNRDDFYINGQRVTDPEKINIFNTLSKQGDINKWVGAVRHLTQGVTGKPTIQLQLRGTALTNNKGDFTKLFGQAVEDVNNMTIDIPISDNARGEWLNRLPKATEFNVYDKLKRGETIRSDEFVNTSGFSYEILPDSRNNPTQVKVSIKRKGVNPKTGQVEDLKPIEQWVPLVGDGAKSPDEVMRKVNDLLFQHIGTNQTNSALYNRNMQSSGQTLTYAQVLEQRQKRKEGYSY